MSKMAELSMEIEELYAQGYTEATISTMLRFRAHCSLLLTSI